MPDLMVANLIVLFAAVSQACTGFGFSVMATPFLLLVFAASSNAVVPVSAIMRTINRTADTAVAATVCALSP